MLDFKVGDIVRLRGCTGKQRVTHVGDGVITTKYLHSPNYNYDRRVADFEHVEPTQPKPRPKEDQMTEKTLFQTKEEKPRYGHFLAENAEGRFVLVMSEGGYEDFALDEIEEVVPYTIQVQDPEGKSQHYTTSKGVFEVDDLIVRGCKLGLVIAIDTKKKGAPKLSAKARKVATVAVG